MLAALLTLTCGRHAAACARPVPIRTSELRAVDGAELFLLTRGADRSAPVLLWLHGGPGGAERPLFRYFNSALEEHFITVYFDQRGAGRSFDPDADPGRLTVARHLADLDAVVDHLRQGRGRAKITLIGHSWGAALGLLYAHAYPEKVTADAPENCLPGSTPSVGGLRREGSNGMDRSLPHTRLTMSQNGYTITTGRGRIRTELHTTRDKGSKAGVLASRGG